MAETEATATVTETPEAVEQTQEATEKESKEEQNGVQEEKPQETVAKVEKRKYKYKVDGEEKEAELTDDEIVTALSKAAGADSKFREAAEVREKIIQLFEEGKKNPSELLNALGIDAKKFSEELLYKLYSEEQMPEAERRAVQAERKAKELEEKAKAFDEAQTKAQFEAEVEKYQVEYDKKISDALAKSEYKLPKTPDTVKRIASYLSRALEKGVEASVDDVIPLVYEDIKGGIGEILSQADAEALVKILGEDKAREIAKKIAGTVSTPENRAKPENQGTKVTRKDKKMQWNEFEKWLDETVQGK